jgi:hypothetical protein
LLSEIVPVFHGVTSVRPEVSVLHSVRHGEIDGGADPYTVPHRVEQFLSPAADGADGIPGGRENAHPATVL